MYLSTYIYICMCKDKPEPPGRHHGHHIVLDTLRLRPPTGSHINGQEASAERVPDTVLSALQGSNTVLVAS